MPNNEVAGGPTTKITVEPLFRIRPQTFAHVDHQRAPASSPSHPFHVICIVLSTTRLSLLLVMFSPVSAAMFFPVMCLVVLSHPC
jgi:hypothetical protein